MKIKPSASRQDASGLLLFIVVTFVVFIGGCACYELIRWAKRVDTGEPIQRPGFTNDEEVVIPDSDPPSRFTGGQFIDPHIWFEWVEFEETFAPVTLLSQPDPSPAIPIAMSGDNQGGLVLKILDSSSPQSRVTYQSLGVPVDEYGMPNDLSWRSGALPSGPHETWELQGSVDCLNWQPLMATEIYAGLTNQYLDRDPGPRRFYRAVKIP